jgi:hypothetical protein
MLEVAQQHISKAKRLQKAGSLDEAFDNYQSALGGLLELYKVEQDPKRKVELGAFIEVTVENFRRARLRVITCANDRALVAI